MICMLRFIMSYNLTEADRQEANQRTTMLYATRQKFTFLHYRHGTYECARNTNAHFVSPAFIYWVTRGWAATSIQGSQSLGYKRITGLFQDFPVPTHNICPELFHSPAMFKYTTRMWANAQPDGRPAEHRWRPLFNAAKYGWHPLLDAVQ